MEPASIRYKNPGAMWGSPLAIKWGASPKAVVLNDGKGQGNNIAVFPTYVQGICAQMDLWRTSKLYRNKRFADAIAIWSGHNSVESYIAFVTSRVPGMTRNTVMDDEFWRGPMAIGFLKAQAWHEAGKRYPAPDDDWTEAQRRVLGNVVPPAKPKLTTEWLQSSLNKLGFDVPVTGVPDAKTREAIKAFQRKVGLSDDGLVGPKTLTALEAALTVTPDVIKLPPIILPSPAAAPAPTLAPTFWGRVANLFKPKGTST